MSRRCPRRISHRAALGLRCCLRSDPLLLWATSGRVRARLYAPLAAKDVPVVIEPQACWRHRVMARL